MVFSLQCDDSLFVHKYSLYLLQFAKIYPSLFVKTLRKKYRVIVAIALPLATAGGPLPKQGFNGGGGGGGDESQ